MNHHDVIDEIQYKHPDCNVLISLLPPRLDHLHERTRSINQRIEDSYKGVRKVHIINHDNIKANNEHLSDKKHLNSSGVRVFAKNIKSVYFKSLAERREHQPRHHFRQPSQYGQRSFPIPTMQQGPRPTHFIPQHNPKIPQPPPAFPLFGHLTPRPYRPPPPLMNIHKPNGTIPQQPSMMTNGAMENKSKLKLPEDLIKLVKQLHGYVS